MTERYFAGTSKDEHVEGEHKVDRSGWDDGAWDNEPDKALWKYKGYDCMIVRSSLGALCGYVGVHEGHPWFGVDYDKVDADVHGGLTYSDYCQGVICHPSPQKTFWLGFDTAHLGDLVPGMSRHFPSLMGKEKYKNWAYVKAQVVALAKQAMEVATQ